MNPGGCRTSRVLAMVLVSLAVVLAGCQRAKEKRAERMMEDSIEKATGKKASVGLSKDKVTIAGEGTKTEIDSAAAAWPAGIPNEVPRFNQGRIQRTTRSEGPGFVTWGVHFAGVAVDALEVYNESLAGAGFNPRLAKMGNSGQLVAQKGQLRITFLAGKGDAHLSVHQRDRQ